MTEETIQHAMTDAENNPCIPDVGIIEESGIGYDIKEKSWVVGSVMTREVKRPYFYFMRTTLKVFGVSDKLYGKHYYPARHD